VCGSVLIVTIVVRLVVEVVIVTYGFRFQRGVCCAREVTLAIDPRETKRTRFSVVARCQHTLTIIHLIRFL
jgi:hypothetical protein